MKKLILAIAFGLFIFMGHSQTNSNTRYQKGYTKKNGTYVQAHYKTQTNKTNHDNYSTTSNTNAYTEKKGYRAKDYSSEANNYGSRNTIKTGSKGGQYYQNRKSKKTYVPKR